MFDNHLMAFAVTLGYVAGRAFQQLNVQHRHYWLVPLGSIVMGAGDFYLLNLIVKSGSSIIAATASGGAIGTCLAMYLHDRWVKHKNKEAP